MKPLWLNCLWTMGAATVGVQMSLCAESEVQTRQRTPLTRSCLWGDWNVPPQKLANMCVTPPDSREFYGWVVWKSRAALSHIPSLPWYHRHTLTSYHPVTSHEWTEQHKLSPRHTHYNVTVGSWDIHDTARQHAKPDVVTVSLVQQKHGRRTVLLKDSWIH